MVPARARQAARKGDGGDSFGAAEADAFPCRKAGSRPQETEPLPREAKSLPAKAVVANAVSLPGTAGPRPVSPAACVWGDGCVKGSSDGAGTKRTPCTVALSCTPRVGNAVCTGLPPERKDEAAPCTDSAQARGGRESYAVCAQLLERGVVCVGSCPAPTRHGAGCVGACPVPARHGAGCVGACPVPARHGAGCVGDCPAPARHDADPASGRLPCVPDSPADSGEVSISAADTEREKSPRSTRHGCRNGKKRRRTAKYSPASSSAGGVSASSRWSAERSSSGTASLPLPG